MSLHRSKWLWLGVLGFIALATVAILNIGAVLGCSDAERALFDEIRHVEGIAVGATHHLDASSCSATFTTNEPVGSVVSHYSEDLGRSGWSDVTATDHSTTDVEQRRMEAIDLMAKKGRFYFIAHIRNYDDQPETNVTIHVSDE